MGKSWLSISEKILYWAPRLASICFVLFLSVFAWDVFSEYSGTSVILPLLIHLIPSFVLLGAVLLAWKYELVGVVMFFGFAFLYVWNVGFDRPWSWYASIVAPATVVGILFLISWSQKARTRPETPD